MDTSESNSVEASFLANVINDDSYLVIDCRNFLDYNVSHIRSSINAFYSKIIRRRILNSKNCAESVLSHLSRGIENTLSKGFDQLTLVLYGNGCDVDTKNLSNFRFPSVPSTSMATCFELRRSASEETTPNHLDSNSFITALIEHLRNTNICKNVLLLKGGFNDFHAKFPDLCDSSSQLNTPETPCSQPFNLRLDASANKCAKLQQQPNNSTMKTMSNSTSHPCLGNSIYRTVCSSEGTTPNAQITQILDFVFLGSQDDAQDSCTLRRHGITRIINLSDSCPKSDIISNDHFMRIPVKDSYDAKLWPHFDHAYEFIEDARRTNQKVLVHCLAGISRSPTLAIAYIMRSKKLTVDDAYKFVKTRRPSVSPNLNFMGQLFLYERHLREQNILPPAARPRSNVLDDFTPPPSKDSLQLTVAEPPKAPILVTERLCKSASVNFPMDTTSAETRKRVLDTPLSLPCRPRQLMKNCCARKNLDEPPQLPSPSTEFSKLDISLSNPCFGTNPAISFNSQPQTSTQQETNVENPVFGLLDNKNQQSPKLCKKPTQNNHLFNLFARRVNNNCKLSASKMRCKLASKCYSRHSTQKSSPSIPDEGLRSTNVENVRFRIPRFSRLAARTSVNIMPTLHDDEVDSGKGSSVSHSVSTEDGEQSTTPTAISSTTSDPERDSLSSASSLEIAVQ